MFDADLGWLPRYATPFDDRPRSHPFERPLASAFGDSFTRGDEVDNHETWGEALAERIDGEGGQWRSGSHGFLDDVADGGEPSCTALLARLDTDWDALESGYHHIERFASVSIEPLPTNLYLLFLEKE